METCVASGRTRPCAGSPAPDSASRRAPGKAILSLLPEGRWPAGASDELRAAATSVATDGYATSHDEVIPSLHAVAVPLALRGREPAAIAVVYLATAHDPARIAERLNRSAALIREALGG